MTTQTPTRPNIETAHMLYDECAKTLVGCYSAEFLDQARSDEEEQFWVCVADFFLQRRQAELIREGVF